MTLGDEDLVQQSLNGRDSAFAMLVDKYKAAVHALAQKKLGNYHDAEEVAQEAFLKAYQNLPSLKEPNRFPGWLYVITANECRRRLKLRGREETSRHAMEDITYQQQTALASLNPSKQMNTQLDSALDALPESDQTVIHLYHFGGLTCEEISRFLGTSPNAVKMRLSRARKRLKKEMIVMLEKNFGIISPSTQFTIRIMERIESIRFLSPRTLHTHPLARLIPIGTLLFAALAIGIGLFSQHMAVPPTSWDAAREIDVPIELINLPFPGTSLKQGGETAQANAILVQANKAESSAHVKGSKDASVLAAMSADDEDENAPHVSGIVVSKQTGQPIPDAVISLTIRTPEGTKVEQAVTDASGNFRLNADVLGKPIGIKAKGYGFRFVQFPDGQKVVKSLRIELEPGVSVKGTVVDSANNPIANAKVDTIVGLSYGRIWVGETRTDDKGKYVLSDLNPLLPFWISASHPKYNSDRRYSTDQSRHTLVPALHGSVVQPLVLNSNLPPEDYPKFSVSHATNEEVPKRIPTGISVQGFVETEGDSPVTQAIVKIGESGTDSQAVVAETNDEGYYRATNVRPGLLHLLIRAEGFSPFHERIDTRKGKSFQKNFNLAKSPIFKARVIDDLAGNPISDIRVLLQLWYHNKDSSQPPDLLDLELSTATDAMGEFTFNQVPQEGFFQIDILGNKVYQGRRDQYKFLPSRHGYVDFAGFSTHYDGPLLKFPPESRLKQKAHIKVRVVDAETNKPITNFYVSFHLPSTQNAIKGISAEWVKETDQGGCYIYATDGLFMSPSIGEGLEVSLLFRTDGYASAAVENAESRVDPEIITVGLVKEKLLYGRAIDAATGKPIEIAWVKGFGPMLPLRLHSGEPESISGMSDLSDAEGRFTLPQMGDAQPSFYVQHADYAPAIFLKQEFLGNDQNPVLVRLGTGGEVAGTAPPGKLVALAFAEHLYDKAEPPGERPYFELLYGMVADDQGGFRFERLPPGKYFIGIAEGEHFRLEVNNYLEPETVHIIEVEEGTVTRRNLP